MSLFLKFYQFICILILCYFKDSDGKTADEWKSRVIYQGVPIVYYGTEQEFAGKNDPENRESLWPYQNSSSRMYKAVVFLTRRGHSSGIHTKSFTNMTGFKDGTVLQNIFDCSDTVIIAGGKVTVRFKEGLPLVYVQKGSAQYTVCSSCLSSGNSCDSNGISDALFDQRSYIISVWLTLFISIILNKQH
ncbi:hypothetical protein KUTeg_005044 [Tegillarca granosa]|uniref:Alpha-amylase domain-containing protein n=1 Tax=Tegillarca granosa TaxID=220873 RepID=A0ABQ9FLI6_TEGGR|nr:hypothetical protein KUTeg_005044 [Tegillarca granosa]